MRWTIHVLFHVFWGFHNHAIHDSGLPLFTSLGKWFPTFDWKVSSGESWFGDQFSPNGNRKTFCTVPLGLTFGSGFATERVVFFFEGSVLIENAMYMKMTRSFETSGTIVPLTQRHNSEDPNPWFTFCRKFFPSHKKVKCILIQALRLCTEPYGPQGE